MKKEIPGFEGMYSVFSSGEVRSLDRIAHYQRNGKTFEKRLKGRPLQPGVDKDGYHFVIFSKEHCATLFKLHRLVAQSFIPNPDNKPQVNHKNGIKTDNHVENLEWCTDKENKQHMYRILKVGIGEGHSQAKLTANNVKSIRMAYTIGRSQARIAEDYNISPGTVSDIIRGKTWNHLV